MAIAPFYWRQAWEEAPIHVQIQLKKRPQRGVSDKLGGSIICIFRDDTYALKLHQGIEFPVNWREGPYGGGEDGPPMPGRQSFYFDRPYIDAARFAEVYLAPDGEGFRVAWDQLTLLMKPTLSPANPAGGPDDYGIMIPPDVVAAAQGGGNSSSAGGLFAWLRKLLG